MRRALPFLVVLLATTACGQSERSSYSPSDESAPANAVETFAAEDAAAAPSEAARASRAGGPNIGPTAAPGVAFNYRYAFRLAAPRISEVQERHAQMCEQLGVRQCRITGMLYRVVNNRDIEARLELKLDPAVARRFGREGVDAVVRAQGMLTESQISGVDVGSRITQATRSIGELTAELERIEAQLRSMGSGARKSELEYQAGQLREQIRALRETRTQSEDSLATTPMVFHYGSGALVPGFDQGPTLKQALDEAGESFLYGVYILMRILIAILPWALAAGLLLWLGRLIRRRWFPTARFAGAAPEPAPEPEPKSDA